MAPKSDIIISVQSQKGGVGKTTVALNLASLLLPEYRVLFFDLDIVGTAASNVPESPFWVTLAHVVKFGIGDESSESDKISDNLVNLYAYFMRGNAVCKFDWHEKKPEDKNDKKPKVDLPAQLCFEDRINIFSSSMECSNRKAIYQHAPQVLFDEAHAEWFMDMIREIVNGAKKETTVKKRPLAIILDCAPGYSGLGPYVEEWLTDIGPEKAHFVFVASADTQDVMACTYAIKRLEELYLLKLGVAKEYQTWLRVSDGCDVPAKENLTKDTERAFFIRLAECGHAGKAAQSLSWYSGTDKNVIDVWEKALSKTWSLVHNRVPASLTNTFLVNHLSKIIPGVLLSDNKYTAIAEVLQHNVRERVIPYDDAVALQFITAFRIDEVEILEQQTKPVEQNVPEPPSLVKNFNSLETFIGYMLDVQQWFMQFAQLVQPPSDAKVQISWYEFSPVWLFLQQFHVGINRKMIERVSDVPIKAFSSEVVERVRFLQGCIETDNTQRSENWIEQVYLAAFAMAEILGQRVKQSSPIRLQAFRVKLSMLKQLEVQTGFPRDTSWPKQVFEIKAINFEKGYLDEASIAFKKSAVLLASEGASTCLSFCKAYNYVLRGESSLALMGATAKCNYTGVASVMYQVLAESLFHHVLHVRDLSLEQVIQLLRSVGSITADPRVLLRTVMTLKQMEKMTEVLRPILEGQVKGVK